MFPPVKLTNSLLASLETATVGGPQKGNGGKVGGSGRLAGEKALDAGAAPRGLAVLPAGAGPVTGGAGNLEARNEKAKRSPWLAQLPPLSQWFVYINRYYINRLIYLSPSFVISVFTFSALLFLPSFLPSFLPPYFFCLFYPFFLYFLVFISVLSFLILLSPSLPLSSILSFTHLEQFHHLSWVLEIRLGAPLQRSLIYWVLASLLRGVQPQGPKERKC